MENVVKSYNSKVRPLSEVMIGSRVALQNHETKQWDIYGTVTDITPHRHYFYQDAEWQGPGSQEKICMTIPVETASEKQSIISQMQIIHDWVKSLSYLIKTEIESPQKLSDNDLETNVSI